MYIEKNVKFEEEKEYWFVKIEADKDQTGEQ